MKSVFGDCVTYFSHRYLGRERFSMVHLTEYKEGILLLADYLTYLRLFIAIINVHYNELDTR